MNQFDDAGIVTRHHFEGGKSVFELATQHHHDHLVCLDCGKVIEFSDELIERRQKEIAAQYNVDLTNHSLYLYGHCANGDCCKDEPARSEIIYCFHNSITKAKSYALNIVRKKVDSPQGQPNYRLVFIINPQP